MKLLKWSACEEHSGRHLLSHYKRSKFKIETFLTRDMAYLLTWVGGKTQGTYHENVKLAKRAAVRQLKKHLDKKK